MIKTWNVGLYARVSTDKENQSDSIPAQIQSLQSWLKEHSSKDKNAVYNLVETYEDSGASGSNFDREAFARMKQDIEAGKINMVVSRDLSRFGRNYIVAGYYLEEYFLIHGVRFVATLDNVDTVGEIDDIVPFKNVLNEMFIKDCSRKVKDALRQRMERGSCISSKPPYGYRQNVTTKDGYKHIELVPANDETTETVREIFSLYLGGWGYGRISTYLNDKGIAPPGAAHPNSLHSLWHNNGIKAILTNPLYYGVMAQGRYRKISYKTKHSIATTPEEWIVGATFEGIMPREKYEEVQALMKHRCSKHRYKGYTIHPFSTVLRCKECRGSMAYRKKYVGYKCTNSQIAGKRCTPHSVKEEYLVELIRNDLQRYLNELDKSEYHKKSRSMANNHSTIDSKLASINTDLEKLDKKFRQIYSDKLEGVITERNFSSLIADIQNKQVELEKKRDLLAKQKVNEESDFDYVKAYRDKIDAILKLEELDRVTVESLIDEIVVTEDPETRIKSIDVYYKFKNDL